MLSCETSQNGGFPYWRKQFFGAQKAYFLFSSSLTGLSCKLKFLYHVSLFKPKWL